MKNLELKPTLRGYGDTSTQGEQKKSYIKRRMNTALGSHQEGPKVTLTSKRM
ncbi:hypothetical protein SK128_015680, partial [Halocaridina rubra]